jgi:hypothetical protein
VRNLFSLIGFIVVVFFGAGWYLGWYKLAWTTGSDGNPEVKVNVNTGKVKDDVKSGVSRAGEFIDSLKSNPNAEKAAKQAADPNFVGPPIPADYVAPGQPKGPPAAALPGPQGVRK